MTGSREIHRKSISNAKTQSIVKPLNLQRLEAFKSFLLSNWNQCLKSDSTFKFFLKRAGCSPKRLLPSRKRPLFVLARPTTPKLCQGAPGAAPRAQPSWLILHSKSSIPCQTVFREWLPHNLPDDEQGLELGLKLEFCHLTNKWWRLYQSSIGTCQNLEGSAAISEKIGTGRKNALALPQSLRLHALTSTDRIHGLFWSRSMCMAMNLFSSVLSNAGCPWIMPISPNFWRSHSRRYCPEHNSTTDDTESIPLF